MTLVVVVPVVVEQAMEAVVAVEGISKRCNLERS